MADLDALIEEFRTDGREEDAAELEKLRGSTLRKQAGEAAKLQKRAEEAEAKLEVLESAPKRTAAFKEYGIDLEGLSKAEQKVLETFDGDPSDKDAIAAFVEEFDLPLAEEPPEGNEASTEPAAAQVASAAKRAPRTGGTPVITAKEASTWSTEKLLRFREEHPEQFEALKRNETVTGIAG